MKISLPRRILAPTLTTAGEFYVQARGLDSVEFIIQIQSILSRSYNTIAGGLIFARASGGTLGLYISTVYL